MSLPGFSIDGRYHPPPRVDDGRPRLQAKILGLLRRDDRGNIVIAMLQKDETSLPILSIERRIGGARKSRIELTVGELAELEDCIHHVRDVARKVTPR